MIRHVLAGIKQNYPTLGIVIHAQLYVEKMYEKLGFTPVGEIFQEAQRDHILMTHPVMG